MIRLEYDQPSAGVKVSFILRDSQLGGCWRGNFQALVAATSNDGDTRVCPQTSHNMTILKRLADLATDGE
jgi:hypothetical protein